jgi:hypothetical protein
MRDPAILRRLVELAQQSALIRHHQNSDSYGYGVRDGHSERFKECPHPDCLMVQPLALSVDPPPPAPTKEEDVARVDQSIGQDLPRTPQPDGSQQTCLSISRDPPPDAPQVFSPTSFGMKEDDR